MNISFTKAQATGNDFIIIYYKENLNLSLTPELIRGMCHRQLGVGSDGLLFISYHSSCDFMLDYYNNDGSWETLCANGMRCAALYMYNKGLIKPKSSVMCGDGPHEIKISNSIISTKMKPPTYKTDELCIFNYKGMHVDSGAQHFSILVDDVLKIDVVNDGRKVRYDNIFLPKGINVNFYSVNKKGIDVRTYEKGIEDEMLSCGSGSVACVFDAHKKLSIKSPVNIKVCGGALSLSFNKQWDDVWLSGSASLIFEGTINMVLPYG